MSHHLHDMSLVSTWVALGAGVVVGAMGGWLVVRPGARGERRVTDGWSQILMGLFIATETIPRVSGASDGVTMAMSLVAFLPLALSVALVSARWRRARR